MQHNTTEHTPSLTLSVPTQRLEDGLSQSSPALADYNNASKQELSHIVFLVAAFTSSIASVTNAITSKDSAVLHFSICAHSLHFLSQAFGDWVVAVVALTAATILSLIDIYTGGNVAVFASTIVVTSFGGTGFIWATVLHNHDADKARKNSTPGSKLFVTTSMLLKVLLDYGIIPTSASRPAVINELQRAFFAESFILLVAALILNASGVPIRSPIRRASFSLASKNRAAIMASTLYWSGVMLVVANVIITVIVASAETPMVIRVACVTFAVCAAAVVIKAPTNLENSETAVI